MGEFSWGPEKRAKTEGSLVTTALGVAVVVLLIAGIAAAVVERSNGSSSTPAHFQRLTDSADHLSLAAPDSWQVPGITAGSVSGQIQDLEAKNPKLTPLADILLAVLQNDRLGVFAIDATTQTSLFAYGTDDPLVKSADQISGPTIVSRLQAVGAQDVQVTTVHLRLGAAKQVSDRLTLGGITISEVVDYVPRDGRLVAIVLVAPGSQPPTSLLHQIQGTLKAA